MARDNVEIVDRCYVAARSLDVELLTADWHPDVVCDMTRYKNWDGGVYSGAPDVLDLAREWMMTWSSYTLRADELTPIGDQVLALAWHTGWVPGREERVKEEWAMLWTLRDGQIVRLECFSDRDEARSVAEGR